MENNAYHDIIREREELKSKYNTELLKLNTKKEKLWTQMDITKFDLDQQGNIDMNKIIKDKTYAFKNMCYKETQTLAQLHNRLGYINKMCMNELKRMINSQCVRYRNNFKTFTEAYYPSLTDV